MHLTQEDITRVETSLIRKFPVETSRRSQAPNQSTQDLNCGQIEVATQNLPIRNSLTSFMDRYIGPTINDTTNQKKTVAKNIKVIIK